MLRLTILLIALFVATTTTPAAESWPQFRGPTGDGHP